MILAMTLMVRDEADIVEAMIEHHLKQGVDVIIATDNGSVDGTLDLLKSYVSKGVVDLREDPAHNKQQGQVVTAMARDAFSVHHADWVLNADADEFWLPVDRSLTLKDVFEKLPKSLQSFPVPVVDMIGAPAQSGSGLSRLIYRDTRPVEALHEVGLLAHSTHDAAHIGSPDIQVAQGNHYVSLESMGSPSRDLAIEVLHLPWRSWEQYKGKVEKSGKAYQQSGLTPSPNHHGMRDFRRLKNGTLFAYYVARHPDDSELADGISAGYLTEDSALQTLAEPRPDVPLNQELERATREVARAMIAAQNSFESAQAEGVRLRESISAQNARIEELVEERDALRHTTEGLEGEVDELRKQLDTMSNRRSVRLIDGVVRRTRRALKRHG